jgi:hypothetical protein
LYRLQRQRLQERDHPAAYQEADVELRRTITDMHVNRHRKRGHFRREDEPPCRLPIAPRLELAGDLQNRAGRVSGRKGTDFR